MLCYTQVERRRERGNAYCFIDTRGSLEVTGACGSVGDGGEV